MLIQDKVDEFINMLEQENKINPIDTGLRDREGKPIMVGDYVFYHNPLTRRINDDEDINDFPDCMICGSGHKGYVYTGKERRIRGRVTYSLRDGVSLNLNGRYHWNRWIDNNGYLIRVEKVTKAEFVRFGGDIVPYHFFSR